MTVPKRVILAAWLVAAAGALTAALARTWLLASAGYVIFMLCIGANPATVSYVLLNTPDRETAGSAERVMATVFASWPAAMVFALALGGLIAAWRGIQADLWIGAAGLVAATCFFALAGDTLPAAAAGRPDVRSLLRNRSFVALAVYFAIALLALNLGYALAPTYLEDARGFSPNSIGLLFSLSSIGMLLFRSVMIKFEPRSSFAVLVGAAWLGLLALWQVKGTMGLGAAFVLLGAISATWVAMQASIGRAVAEPMQGLALGLTEVLYAGGIALASWLAGQLYGNFPGHELPLIVGSAATLAVLAVWMVLPLARHPSGTGRIAARANQRLTRSAPGGQTRGSSQGGPPKSLSESSYDVLDAPANAWRTSSQLTRAKARRREVGKEAVDGGIQLGQIAEGTIGGDVALERPPDLLDGIEPMTTVGRQVHQRQSALHLQPTLNRPAGMNAGIVDQHVHAAGGVSHQHQVQEGDGIGTSLVRGQLVEPFASGTFSAPNTPRLAFWPGVGIQTCVATRCHIARKIGSNC